jgi:RecB family endonuclease NucS
MSEITHARISWDGILLAVAACVEKWRPPPQIKEIAYSRLLAEHLRLLLPRDAQVEGEYRHAGETLDVFVRCSGMLMPDEVFIEVKRRLVRKPEFNRLVGQISALDPGKHKILIVLIGTCDVELVGRLRHQFRQYMESAPAPLVQIPTLRIVEVPEMREST